MSKAVFMNLSIDQLFDPAGNMRKIFSVRIPQSEHLTRVSEDLAIFLTGPGDYAIQYREIPSGLQKVFQDRGFQFGKVIPMIANPFDQKLWIDEVHQKTIGLNLSHWQVAGMSQLEKEIVVKNNSIITVEQFAELNKKTWLPELADKNGWNFPISEIAKTGDLTSKLSQWFAKKLPFVLKPSWSSGGGGNLYLERTDDSIYRHLVSRLEQIQPGFEWIIQEKIDRTQDWSITASTENDVINVYTVFYDKSGLSYRHQKVSQPIVIEAYNKISSAIGLKLKDLGYNGVFGFDSFSGANGEHFPVTDLNVRWTKTHLIEAAIEKLKLHTDVESYRFRFQQTNAIDFETGFRQLSNLISSDAERLFIPYQASGMHNDLPGQTEISFFTNSNLLWQSEVLAKIQKIWGA